MNRIFDIPRTWSNYELRKFSSLFHGSVVNVSGWLDQDKEGTVYRQYFSRASAYTITNYKSEARGFQGKEGEIFLDLTEDLPENLVGKFDVVFNHTVLEHIYEVQKAFSNLCLLSKEVVILVVPFLQKMHADYGDYWRFTPLALKRMFEDNGMNLHYCSFNSHPFASVYIFAIGLKKGSKYAEVIPQQFNYEDPKRVVPNENFIGIHAIPPLSVSSLLMFSRIYLKHLFSKLFRLKI